MTVRTEIHQLNSELSSHGIIFVFFLFSEKNPGSGLKSLAYSFSHFPLLIRVIPVQVTRPDIIPLLPSHGRGGGGEGA